MNTREGNNSLHCWLTCYQESIKWARHGGTRLQSQHSVGREEDHCKFEADLVNTAGSRQAGHGGVGDSIGFSLGIRNRIL